MPTESTRDPRLTLGICATAQFVAVMAASVVSVALPTIGRELAAGTTAQEWVVDAYVLVFAALLVAGGVLGDRRGRKGTLMVGLVIFGVGAVAGGLAPSAAWLLPARALQGAGSALVLPCSLALVTGAYPDPRERAAAVGLWSAGSGIGLAIGPAVGGAIVDAVGWRWVLLMNGPLALALLVLAGLGVLREPRTPARTRFDVLGAVLVTAAVAALALGLIEGRTEGWGSPTILGALAGAAVLFVAFAVWELRLAEPLVDVRLFARPAFTASNVAGMAVFFSTIGAIVYFASFFQVVQGRSPAAAGLCVLPLGAGFAVAAPLSGRLVGRVGARTLMVAGPLLAALGMLLLTGLEPGSSPAAAGWRFVLVGVGGGLCLTPMTATVVGSVHVSRAGMASAVHNTMRQVGQVLGVAVLGTLVFGSLDGADPADRGEAFTHGLHQAVTVAAGTLLAAALLAALLVPARPRSVPDALA